MANAAQTVASPHDTGKIAGDGSTLLDSWERLRAETQARVAEIDAEIARLRGELAALDCERESYLCLLAGGKKRAPVGRPPVLSPRSGTSAVLALVTERGPLTTREVAKLLGDRLGRRPDLVASTSLSRLVKRGLLCWRGDPLRRTFYVPETEQAPEQGRAAASVGP